VSPRRAIANDRFWPNAAVLECLLSRRCWRILLKKLKVLRKILAKACRPQISSEDAPAFKTAIAENPRNE
jgi:hypothetical protein